MRNKLSPDPSLDLFTVDGSSIANDAITYAKIQDISATRLLGRATGSAGDPEEIILGTNLSFAGTTLNAAGGGGGGGLTLTTIEVNLGTTPRRAGKFNIVGAGLTIGKPVLISQASGPYTGKGTLTDEAEMDALAVTGKVTSAINVECFWQSNSFVRGNFKFDYSISA